MALKITQKKDTFSVFGIINNTTALNFQNHISLAIKDVKELIIDIENVTSIDSAGMKAIRTIYADCMANNKRIYIVGTGCKEVYDDLYVTSVA
ncbi:STAS domain-containing protein [Hyunsoonleella ulvae]|uniref:STAS domain-containing protein n=1 Tax=Hyunsoonleella ulvae TaxID=2799948 RepID=UPI001939BCCF|nr:STAS domain-containing protein [Hyunsoonleella ulvae]